MMKKLGAGFRIRPFLCRSRKALDRTRRKPPRERKKKTNLQRFAEQFKDVMILILLGAAANLVRRGADLA